MKLWRPPPLALPLAWLVVSSSAVTENTKKPDAPYQTMTPDQCVRCESLFSKLSQTVSGEGVQHIEMQLRGEPKSGTAMMYQWASGALHQMCNFLKASYGEDTCRITWTSENPEDPTQYTNRTLIFEPYRGDAGAPCSCNGVNRVVISISKKNKHMMPVDESCRWWRKNSIAYAGVLGFACKHYRRSQVMNYNDLWGCMREAACSINDDRQQFVVMRDPRAVAVSAYFHRLSYGTLNGDAVKDKFILSLLVPVCQWLTLRHILFTGLMATQSTIYWYEDALADPLDFHNRWLESVGLRPPGFVLETAIHASLNQDFAFNWKGIDVHLGGEEAVEGRSWKNEINPDMLDDMQDVLRVWLSPALQAKLLGV